jgi:hypothetical protein
MSLSKKGWIKRFYSPIICLLICLLAFIIIACQKKDDKSSATKNETSAVAPAPQPAAPATDNAPLGPVGRLLK